MKLCECGCGEPTNVITKSHTKKGCVKGEYRRYIKGHASRSSPFEYIVNEATGCWNWQRAVGHGGYGRTRNANAHHAVYERERGPIPPGMHLDHLCRNRLCVNPDHMEIVTPAENTRRGAQAKLTMQQADEIRVSTENRRVLAERYGVSVWTIDGIRVKKNRWVAA